MCRRAVSAVAASTSSVVTRPSAGSAAAIVSAPTAVKVPISST